MSSSLVHCNSERNHSCLIHSSWLMRWIVSNAGQRGRHAEVQAVPRDKRPSTESHCRVHIVLCTSVCPWAWESRIIHELVHSQLFECLMILFSAACVKFDDWFSGVCVIFMAFGSNSYLICSLTQHLP